jgi:RimJ/RimL family protein N-acetyltransferase
VEVGWRLASWAWGKGYASEAAKESLRIGFEEYAISEIYSFTTESNALSEAVMKRIGMMRRKDLDFDHPNTPGWWGQPHIVYSIDRSTWGEYGY